MQLVQCCEVNDFNFPSAKAAVAHVRRSCPNSLEGFRWSRTDIPLYRDRTFVVKICVAVVAKSVNLAMSGKTTRRGGIMRRTIQLLR